jgi:hypothetical protein
VKEAKPSIFISATTPELGSYRGVAADALKRGGLDPICQERDFTSDYRPIPDFLRAEIDKCDVVIFLVGFFYGSEPREPYRKIRRSYTQWEYAFASELGKPTFIFLATKDCHFDSDVVQGDKEEQLQLDYRNRFSEKYNYFNSKEELQRLVAEAVPKIKESVSPENIVMRMVERHFPTPLAKSFVLAYDRTDTLNEPLNLRKLFYETLRFVALIAIQDSFVHCFLKSDTYNKAVKAFADNSNFSFNNWLELMTESYNSDGQEIIIPELKGWYSKNLDALNKLNGCLDEITDAWYRGRPIDKNKFKTFKNGLMDVYKDMSFLKYYLFAGIEYDSLLLFRGTQPQKIKLQMGLAAEGSWIFGETFMLRPHDKRGLYLGLSSQCLSNVLNIAELKRPKIVVEDFFSEDSWQRLKTIALPPDQLVVVGGLYCIEKPCVYTGAYADIFRANVFGSENTKLVAVHLLRSDQAENIHSYQWFKQRFENWRKIDHPSVLRPYEESDPESTTPLPFIAVDWINNGKSLEDELFQNEKLDNEKVIEILRTAADICHAAHAKGLRLLNLPLRHILISSNKIFLTGFDTVCQADCGKGATCNQVLNIWRRFPKDRSDFAPEIKTIRHFIPISTDIFALGVLLCRLRNRRFHPMSSIDHCDSGMDRRWVAIEFHCLAKDPELRFQTVEQFRIFLEKWLSRSKYDLPETVEIPPGNVILRAGGNEYKHYIAGFQIGKYPVTNSEYEVFLRAKDYDKLPVPDRRRLGRPPEEVSDDPRFSAPLCPVVGVSWEDADAYCKWLSKTTGGRWRLPSENEWLYAARLDRDCRYPWGDETPKGRANYGLRFSGPTVVGAYPDGKSQSGCLDMAGNVWEWCLDYAGPGNPLHILKGGAFDYAEGALSVEAIYKAVVNYRSINIGFRVLKEGG